MLRHKDREAIFGEGLRPVATQREIDAQIVQAPAKNTRQADSRQNTARLSSPLAKECWGISLVAIKMSWN